MLIQTKQLDLSKDLTFTGGNLRMGTGKVYLPTGTESLPAVTFTADSSSGFLLSEPGEVALSAGGSIGFYLKSDGTIELPGTTGIAVQAGTTAERPSNPLEGILRYNLTTSQLETYIESTWESLALQSQTQPLDSDLTALAGLTATGVIVRTGNGTATLRSLEAVAGQTTVNNGDGVNGNPTVGLATTGVVAASYGRVTVDIYGRVTEGIIKTSTHTSSQLESPSAGWAVTNVATAAADQTYTSLNIRGYDDARSEGAGITTNIPEGATNLKVTVVGRPRTTPTATRVAVFQMFTRRFPIGSTPSAWSAASDLGNYTITAGDTVFRSYSTTLSLNSLGIQPGDFAQFEICRMGGTAADTLSGDFNVMSISLEWT